MHAATDDDGRLTSLARDWQHGLSDISLPEAKAGLDACLKRDDPWPPALQEFRQLCKPPTKPAAHRPHQALPTVRADKARAAREFANIRALLAEGRKRLDADKNRRRAEWTSTDEATESVIL